MGSCIMPSEGIFVEVLEGGLIKAGDVLAADVIDGESTPGKTETGLRCPYLVMNYDPFHRIKKKGFLI